MIGAFHCLGQSWPKNATESQGEPLQARLNFWVSRFYVKSVSYTVKRDALMSKICPQLSQVVLSCLFFQIVNPSIQNLLLRWKLCHFASLEQTYTTLLPIPMHKDLSRGTLFCPRRVLMVQLHVRLFTVSKRFRSNKTFLLCSPFDVKTPKANSEVGFC